MPLTPQENGVRLAVRLTPKASKNGFGAVEKTADGGAQLKAYVTTVPEDGKANKSLIKLLSKAVKIPASQISVASGQTNRNKQILFDGAPDELMRRLSHWIKDLTP